MFGSKFNIDFHNRYVWDISSIVEGKILKLKK